jgi:hypothetical protein
MSSTKDVVLYEAVPRKFILSFLELYYIFYKISNFINGQVHKLDASSSQDIGERWPRNGSGLALHWECRPKVLMRLNCRLQQAAAIPADGRGGKRMQ